MPPAGGAAGGGGVWLLHSRPWLFQADTLLDLRATVQWANPTQKGLGGERHSAEALSPKGVGKKLQDREMEWIQRGMGGGAFCHLTGPWEAAGRGAVLAWPGLCNSASFDRHGPFCVGDPAPGCAV